MDVEAILREQESWLRGRAKMTARALGARSHALEADADDIFQEVCLSFVEYARGGWFDQKPRISFEAQVRHLLGNCLRHAKTHRIRAHARLELADDPRGPGLEALLGGEGGESERHQKIDHETRLRQLKGAVLEGLPAGRRLFLLALRYPAQLRQEHILAASQVRVGGARPVCRQVDEAWSLYRAQLAAQEPDGDEADWKKTIAEIFQGAGALGSLAPADLKRAVNYVDVQYGRAVAELQLLLDVKGRTE